MVDSNAAAYSTAPSADPKAKTTKTYHFTADGVVAWGQVWYRGQEVHVDTTSDHYKATLDKDGKSWLDLSVRDQIARWGEQKIAAGEWPGKALDEIEDDIMADPSLSADDKAFLADEVKKKTAAK